MVFHSKLKNTTKYLYCYVLSPVSKAQKITTILPKVIQYPLLAFDEVIKTENRKLEY
jgi:hypothetical protein